MGRRSLVETVIRIIGAFLEHRTWSQASLARHVGLEARAVRKHLEELRRRGFPLERDEDLPHVYWSVPKGWFPGGLLLTAPDAELLLKLLCRLPVSPARDALLARVTSSDPQRAAAVDALRAVVDARSEARHLDLVAEAASRKQVLRMRYYSAARGALEWRHVSVQRLLAGTPARFVAYCHRSSRLKWFRVDGILDAACDATVEHWSVPAREVDELLSTSVDGFVAPGPVLEHCFFVPASDARWVERNLLEGMTPEPIDSGLRVRCRTASVLQVARYVLSLAPVARAETPELAKVVEELAESVLVAQRRPKALGPSSEARTRRTSQPRQRAPARRTS